MAHGLTVIQAHGLTVIQAHGLTVIQAHGLKIEFEDCEIHPDIYNPDLKPKD
ncbi:hypothetical protein F5B18DRAFT_657277 [Nemania serpens]|nr:hypothetical protein F5B18DRAFT_657277 [Nemania serpens]